MTATFASGVLEILNPKAKAKDASTNRRNLVSLNISPLGFHEISAVKIAADRAKSIRNMARNPFFTFNSKKMLFRKVETGKDPSSKIGWRIRDLENQYQKHGKLVMRMSM